MKKAIHIMHIIVKTLLIISFGSYFALSVVACYNVLHPNTLSPYFILLITIWVTISFWYEIIYAGGVLIHKIHKSLNL